MMYSARRRFYMYIEINSNLNIKNESHQTKEFVLYFPRFITTYSVLISLKLTQNNLVEFR